MELAAIIVSWNVRDLVLDTLRTLQADVETYGPDTQVWVVDNASTDGTVEAIRSRFPQCHLIASEKNLGFAGGNNHALRAIGFDDLASSQKDTLPRAVFLLNPDTLIEARAVRALFDALFAADDIGLVGARLTYGDGSFQHSAFGYPGIWQTIIDLLPVPGRLYESDLNGRYPRALYAGDKPFPVGHPLGATMMLRREVIQQAGLFDDQFFMYCEEVDWAMRIHRAGWRVLCVPAAHVTHLEGQSTAQVRPESVLNLWRSRFKLYRKYYSPLKVNLIRLVVRLGMRRKIAQVRQDMTLSDAQRTALIEAYLAVAAL